MADSPYLNLSEDQWLKKTQELIQRHPLTKGELVDVVLRAWNDIFDSRFGPKGFQIGKHIIPKPQIMGFLLHELIPLEFATRYPQKWCGERSATDKDLVCVKDEGFSVEIKTSSNKSQIFGNRSYAQEDQGKGKKNKSGYYLTVNFEKFTRTNSNPKIIQIRFGWIDHSDWKGQEAATGQQAHLTTAADTYKLLTIYTAK